MVGRENKLEEESRLERELRRKTERHLGSDSQAVRQPTAFQPAWHVGSRREGHTELREDKRSEQNVDEKV